jgi:hypothetical protein
MLQHPLKEPPVPNTSQPISSVTTPLATTLALLLAATTLAGCSTTTSATASGTWKDKAALAQPFTRVLVVGVSPDVNQRCPFERLLASRIQSAGTAAFASCDVVAQKTPLTRESIDAAVASQKADGVLATTLVSFDWNTGSSGRDTRGGGMYKATDSGYGMYGVPVVYGSFETAASITTLKGEAHVTTNAYETRGPTLVYTLDSAVQNFESRDQGLVTLVGPIVDKLRRDGLIR